ncbi:cysteine and tyrosine-rich protein 1-like, partial [Sinocyclocheilus grahami]|uniref:cysteine and tyrosine-rich protein 1-like n=1 Tax=Sinocyclocheilus grahami TaxID=75366 RepID=UPI0007AC5EC3
MCVLVGRGDAQCDSCIEYCCDGVPPFCCSYYAYVGDVLSSAVCRGSNEPCCNTLSTRDRSQEGPPPPYSYDYEMYPPDLRPPPYTPTLPRVANYSPPPPYPGYSRK